MSGNRVIIALSVAGLLLLSGCGILGNTEIIGIDGEFNTSDSTFYLNGEVVNSSPGDPPAFQNVTVYLYAQNETLLESQSAGTLRYRANFSIRSDTLPEYVIVDSPEFWEYGSALDGISVKYYRLTEENYYTVESVGSRDDLPVPVPPNSSTSE